MKASTIIAQLAKYIEEDGDKSVQLSVNFFNKSSQEWEEITVKAKGMYRMGTKLEIYGETEDDSPTVV